MEDTIGTANVPDTEIRNDLDEVLDQGVTPEHWDEDRTPCRRLLYLHADTYHVEPIFDITPSRPEDEEGYILSPKKTFAYRNRVLPKWTPLELATPKRGLVAWTDDIVIPTLIDMGRHCHTGERFPAWASEEHRAKWGNVWMSLTPNEMISQRTGIDLAEGTVVVGGLGLGWFVRKVCEKPTVERVIVVEWSQELLDWYGYELCKRFEKVTDVICDDVYNQIGKHGRAKYLLDIWPIFQGARDDPQYWTAKRKLGKRLWAWGIN